MLTDLTCFVCFRLCLSCPEYTSDSSAVEFAISGAIFGSYQGTFSFTFQDPD